MNGDAGRMRAPLEMNDHYFGSGCPKVYLSIEECKKSSPHIPVSFGFSEYSLQNFLWLGIFWRGAYWVGFNLGEKKIVRCLMLVAFPKSQCVFRP